MGFVLFAFVVASALGVTGPPTAWLTFVPNDNRSVHECDLCRVPLSTGNPTDCTKIHGVNDSIEGASFVDNCTAHAYAGSVIMVVNVCLRPPAVVGQIPTRSPYAPNSLTWDTRRGVFYATTSPDHLNRPIVVSNATTGEALGRLNVTIPSVPDAVSEPYCLVLTRLGGPGNNVLFAFLRCGSFNISSPYNRVYVVRVCTINLASADSSPICRTTAANAPVITRSDTLIGAGAAMPLIVTRGQNGTTIVAASVNFATGQADAILELPSVPLMPMITSFSSYVAQGWSVVCYMIIENGGGSQCTAFNAVTGDVVTTPVVPDPDKVFLRMRGLLPLW